jgi:hypothetical protein
MSREIGLWRVDDKPIRMTPQKIDLEQTLEQLIEADPRLLEQPVMIIGRQVPTDHGKFIDLLAIDSEGTVHVLELKRHKTPRDVVAQALDYGSWVQELSHQQVIDIFDGYSPDGVHFEQAFVEQFGESPPEELNEAHTLTIVASEVDPATERIVDYLIGYQVPINVMFFRYFEDDGHRYLARTWLVDDKQSVSKGGKTSRTKEQWNGLDWYVSFGTESDTRSWEDAMKFGFVSAGGGKWYTQTMRGLPIGARVWVCVPKYGYVGVGEVTAEAIAADSATLMVDEVERKFGDLNLRGNYDHGSDEPDDLEYIVAVNWIDTVPLDNYFWETGMFANQNSACKLRNRFTLERLSSRFDIAP